MAIEFTISNGPINYDLAIALVRGGETVSFVVTPKEGKYVGHAQVQLTSMERSDPLPGMNEWKLQGYFTYDAQNHQEAERFRGTKKFHGTYNADTHKGIFTVEYK